MIERQFFGESTEGIRIDKITLSHPSGSTFSLLTFGAHMHSLCIPDRNGHLRDIILGFDDLASYEYNLAYIGSFIGRFANRISRGQFQLQDNHYYLPLNERIISHLHGGPKGFHKQIWNVTSTNDDVVHLAYLSKDGEEGYPGNLQVQLKMYWEKTEAPILVIEMEALTDKPTHVNLTYHPYFHLAGDFQEDVLKNELCMFADHITEIDELGIPTGTLMEVEHTPFDFRNFRAIGSGLNEIHPQLQLKGGYDHNYVLNNTLEEHSSLALGASVRDHRNGIQMDVHTTQPGIQFFTAGFLNSSFMGKNNQAYFPNCGFCLEPQHFPDTPNQPAFPSTEVTPEKPYQHKMKFEFSTLSSAS